MIKSVYPRDSPFWLIQSQLIRNLNYIFAIWQSLTMGVISHHVHKSCSQSRGEDYIGCEPQGGAGVGGIIFSLPILSPHALSPTSPSIHSKASWPKVTWPYYHQWASLWPGGNMVFVPVPSGMGWGRRLCISLESYLAAPVWKPRAWWPVNPHTPHLTPAD